VKILPTKMEFSVRTGSGAPRGERGNRPPRLNRTKKVQKPIVLYDATKEHPAQTQLITEDVVVGYWDTVKHSGALPAPRKKELMSRIEKLSQALKFAREKANAADAETVSVGKPIFDYLLQ
jgi:hypothetical protein